MTNALEQLPGGVVNSGAHGIHDLMPFASSGVPLWYVATFGCLIVVVIAWLSAWNAKRRKRDSTAKQKRVIAAATLVMLLAGFATIALSVADFLVAIAAHHSEWRVGMSSVLFFGLAYYCRLLALSLAAATLGVIANLTAPRPNGEQSN
jgi:hypothetical protein